MISPINNLINNPEIDAKEVSPGLNNSVIINKNNEINSPSSEEIELDDHVDAMITEIMSDFAEQRTCEGKQDDEKQDEGKSNKDDTETTAIKHTKRVSIEILIKIFEIIKNEIIGFLKDYEKRRTDHLSLMLEEQRDFFRTMEMGRNREQRILDEILKSKHDDVKIVARKVGRPRIHPIVEDDDNQSQISVKRGPGRPPKPKDIVTVSSKNSHSIIPSKPSKKVTKLF